MQAVFVHFSGGLADFCACFNSVVLLILYCNG